MTTTYMTGPHGYDLAFVHTQIADGAQERTAQDTSLVVFLGGFKSDMAGSKAVFLEERAKSSENGFDYLRLDYGGHGLSGGRFEEGSVKTWAADAIAVIKHCMRPAQKLILIGSSMGGWISYLLAEHFREQVLGLISINPAPDFTDEFLDQMTPDQKDMYESKGYFTQPNAYSDEPYIFSRNLIEESRECFLLTRGINYKGPVHILSGLNDDVVPPEKAKRVKAAFQSNDVSLHFIEGGDHSLSRDEDLSLLHTKLLEMIAQAS